MALIGTRRAIAAARPWWTAASALLDGVAPSILADYGRDRYAFAGRTVGFSDLFALTSGAKWIADASGAFVSAAAGSPAFDWSLGRRRLLLEGASTNTIRNSTCVGVVAGTPGTAPTNWSASIPPGTTRTIVGAVTVAGVACCDIQYAGTTTSSSASSIDFETTVAATAGQVWTVSVFLAVPAGTLSGISALTLSLNCLQSDGTTSVSVLSGASLGVTAVLTRYQASFTLPANTAYVRPRLRFTYASGVAIDVTLRVGRPQFEQTPAATSPIATTGSATATRVTDQLLLRPAAAALVAAATGTLALAGRIQPSGPSGTPQGILGNSAIGTAFNGIIRTNSADTGLATDLAAGGFAFDAAAGFAVGVGAEIGAAVRWSTPLGRRGGSNLGKAIVTETTQAIIPPVAPIGYGEWGGNGLAAGAVHWHDALSFWPVFASDAALQAQARAWS